MNTVIQKLAKVEKVSHKGMLQIAGYLDRDLKCREITISSKKFFYDQN